MERLELARRLGVEPRLEEGGARPVVIDERDPERFLAAFAAAVAGGGPVFLGDPTWSPGRREEFRTLVERADTAATPTSRGWLMIPSGGTSGALKLARHDEETIAAAVRGFCRHFGFERVNTVGVLPLYHVSGFMAWMRSVLTGGEYRAWDWKRLEAGDAPAVGPGDWVISLVPTQLQRLLQSASTVAWLRQFRAIFVGGGPMWPELADSAAREHLPLSISYGMTETAAMIAALRPAEFLSGARSCGAALPHARVHVSAEGGIVVGGESLFRGYWPDLKQIDVFPTDDLGEIDGRGHLHVLGRRDAAIISGGKKLHPAPIEAALRASGEFVDVAVIGVPDAEWGEVVVACYPSADRAPDLARAVAALAAHERPKRFVALENWPRNPQGKIDRAALRRHVSGE